MSTNQNDALHEARHCLVAWQYNFKVHRVTLVPHPLSKISMPMAPGDIAASYRDDAQGTAWDLERMISVALANGNESSDDDKAILAKWQERWPRHARPTWAALLFNGQERAAEALEFIGERRLQQFAATLGQEWTLFGEKLKVALYWPHDPPRPLRPRQATKCQEKQPSVRDGRGVRIFTVGV